ncbi:MAG: C39 family peptidase [Firmicutes bacterium]|nr:C39 family peptidase [Bacillota bacterium]
MNTKLWKNADLKQGRLSNLNYDEARRALVLAGPLEGVFLAEPVETEEPFNDLVASWNALTPGTAEAEVYGRLRVDGRWSAWMSWGVWGTHIRRACPDQEDGLVWANTYRDGGDSSVNVKDGKTADAFQLKAVLRVRQGAQHMPSLTLLAATWKNTNDPDWQEKCDDPECREGVGELPERVHLDTPVISQKRRDPDYGGVICSATSIAMQMSGLGLDMLPEEATFLCNDYGFDGTGNWSYTVACAGAHGFESYACYMSKEDLMAELAKGNPVGLSVKYSWRSDFDVPQLDNATVTTHGHLVVATGYYFNEELSETVFYVNDPAGGFDVSSGPREYRWSQLSKAWYRRMTYVCRRKEGVPLLRAMPRVEAQLVPEEGRPGVYTLTAEGKPVALSIDFLREKRKTFGGHGTMYWYCEDELSELTPQTKRCTANHTFHYEGVLVTPDGKVWVEGDYFSRLKAKGKTIVFGVIENSGIHYIAKI